MKRVIAALLALTACLFPAASPAFQTERAQRYVSLQVTVLAPPVVLLPRIGGLALITPSSWLLPRATTIAANQGAAKVNANVIADPNANLLVVTPSAIPIQMTQTAGTTATYSCVFTVAVNYSATPWTLDDGLTSDITTNLPATDLAWSAYTSATAPSPETFTGYYNYYTNNKVWQVTATSSGVKKYCVDLRLTVPSNVAPGTYPVTAVYTLYY
jgi:hypothetical protein